MRTRRSKQLLVPWSDLPLHLLQLVSSRLRLIDYLNFRRVCSTWRAAAKRHNPCLDYPLLMTPNSHGSNARLFISASDGKRCRMKLPEFDKRYYCVSCSHGWLLIGNVHLKHLLFLMNPFTGDRIDLPPWDLTLSIHRATLSSPPTEPNCIVIILSFVYSGLTFCRLGDKEWTKQGYSIEQPEDALLFRGKFYILCQQIRLPDTESTGHPKLPVMKLPHHSFSLWKCVSYLVESGDEILLVLKGYKRPRDPRKFNDEVERFIVLQLDLSTSSWIELESLRDHILFLGENCSVSLQATRLGCRGNRIYFTERHHSCWWVFDMEERSITCGLAAGGKYTNNDNHPLWLTPHFV